MVFSLLQKILLGIQLEVVGIYLVDLLNLMDGPTDCNTKQLKISPAVIKPLKEKQFNKNDRIK